MLFCKPSKEKKTLAEYSFSHHDLVVLRALNLSSDLLILSRWKDPSTYKPIINEFEIRNILINIHSHAFVAEVDGLLIASIHCHGLASHELNKFIPVRTHDILIDMVIGPYVKLVPGLCEAVWRLLLNWLLGFDNAERIYTTTALDDQQKGLLLRNLQFRFVENIVGSAEVCSLYMLDKKQFNQPT